MKALLLRLVAVFAGLIAGVIFVAAVFHWGGGVPWEKALAAAAILGLIALLGIMERASHPWPH